MKKEQYMHLRRKSSILRRSGRVVPIEHRAKQYSRIAKRGSYKELFVALGNEPNDVLRDIFIEYVEDCKHLSAENESLNRTRSQFALKGLARIYIKSMEHLHDLHQWAFDLYFETWSSVRHGQYDVSHSVDFRNRNQILLSGPITIKSYTIINGRSDRYRYGVVLGAESYLKERVILDAYGGRIHAQGPIAMGQNVFVHGGGGVTIGKHVIIGPNVCIIASNHNYRNPSIPIMFQGDRAKGIVIGDNVWIGAGAVILDGVSIGNKVVIGAGTIITKDVPDNTVTYGARITTQERIN
ncbi:DapH/DapD/GlmU-related protein [Actinomyces naeslundii]|jgi:transferase hexapeptide repeat containing protein|nr:DapH/DapD/GlmU-related protein [Actinomyces naeslundii]